MLMAGIALSSAYLQAAQVSDEAQSQLVSQAKTVRERSETTQEKKEQKPEIAVEEEKAGEAKPEGPSFFIKKITLSGNTLFSYKELSNYIEPFENREISFADLTRVTKLITNHYSSKGYLTSRAFIPPQQIKNREVIIEIIEGKVGDIKIEGNKFFNDKIYLDAIRLRDDKIFQYQDLETSLYFLNQKPDRNVKAYLTTGKEPTTSDITLKAEEKSPAHFNYEVNNYGTPLTHFLRQTLSYTDNSFRGNGEILNASFTYAEEAALKGFLFGYSVPITSTNTTFSLDTSLVESMIVKHLKSFEIKGESFSITPSITQRLVEKPRFQLDLRAALEIKDSKTLVDDLKSSFDRMRVLVVGPIIILQDNLGKTIMSFNAHLGIHNLLGASGSDDSNASRPNSGNEFNYYTASITRLHRLFEKIFLILRASGQYTKNTLTSVEQYRLGGHASVRGYQESDSSGDYGWNSGAEINMPCTILTAPIFFFVPKDRAVTFTNKNWYDALRVVSFIEGGKTYLREREANTDVKDRFLLGAGVGLRISVKDLYFLQVDMAYPLGEVGHDQDRPRFQFQCTTVF